jgi:FAD/FMN-containing dehydrogenase
VDALARLANPYAIEEDPAAYHTSGWLGAFVSQASQRAVMARSIEDVVSAVRFCAERELPVVVRGTGHDYLGRSSNPDALMIWTHELRHVSILEAFSPQGEAPTRPGVPAVDIGAGARWLEAYQALQPSGRFVQGGGCTSVGVTGFTLGGGFGSFSRRYGTAAGNLLEAEIVTASGEVLVTNAVSHPDLFWALRGGGFGLGVVTRLTMRTHEPPPTLGAVAGTITATSDGSFRRLVRRLVDLFPILCDEHWGEQVRLHENNSVELSLTAAGISEDDAKSAWEPFFSWVSRHPDDYRSDAFVVVTPFEGFWDAQSWDALLPEMIRHDARPGAPSGRFWWATNQGEVSQYIHSYQSHWLPVRLCTQAADRVADALVAASRHWHLSLHFNKALAGAADEAVARDRATAVNPSVFEAAALVIAASSEQFAFPGIPGHEPELQMARRRAARVTAAMAPIKSLAPDAGSYVNETDYFEDNWQQSFWGENYARLQAVKARYDPTNLFPVHHGAGSVSV